jgi:hypothetical protein
MERKQGEQSLFVLSHSLKGRLRLFYNITDLETQRELSIIAYNLTHPLTPYEYKPLD